MMIVAGIIVIAMMMTIVQIHAVSIASDAGIAH